MSRSADDMRVLVVDDEPLARERVLALLREIGSARIVGEAGNGADALAAVQARRPDVVLLDIRMPVMDGLEAARHMAALAAPPAVVFTTAYEEHALAAFEANAVGYLLKPIRKQRLAEALERAAALSRARAEALHRSSVPASPRTHLSAVIGGRLMLVPIEHVQYLIAEQKYVTVGHTGGELIIEDSLRLLEHEFADRLLRVHRNALVAGAYVQALEQASDGRWYLRLRGSERLIHVSRRLLSSVRKYLKQGAFRSR